MAGERMKHRFRNTLIVASALYSACAGARGVTPYLPLHLSPEIERQIERVMILGGKPVVRRPIPAAAVLDALPEACKVDRALCAQVRSYLSLYMNDRGVTLLQADAGVASGDSDRALPNARGRGADSYWQVAASAYYQASDYLLLTGGAAHEVAPLVRNAHSVIPDLVLRGLAASAATLP